MEQQTASNKEETETYIKYNGTNYIYQKALSNENENENKKDNKTIICIHGIGGHIGMFTDLANFFLHKNKNKNKNKSENDKRYNVLRYDLIGRGRSDYPDNNIFDADSHIKQLRDLILYLNINNQKYIIIGHSMGGCLATLYANKFPNEVTALILLSPAGIMDFPSIQWMKMCPDWLHSVVKIPLKYIQEASWRLNFVDHWSPIANKTVAELYELHRQAPTIFDAAWQSLMQFPLQGSEEEVEKLGSTSTIPVLLMWGKKDKIVPYDNLSKWTKLLEKKGELFAAISYEELGHDFYLEDPNRAFNDIYEFFLYYL